MSGIEWFRLVVLAIAALGAVYQGPAQVRAADNGTAVAAAIMVWLTMLTIALTPGCAPAPAPADAVAVDAGVDAGVDARDLCATCCTPSMTTSANCCDLLDAGAASCGWWVP